MYIRENIFKIIFDCFLIVYGTHCIHLLQFITSYISSIKYSEFMLFATSVSALTRNYDYMYSTVRTAKLMTKLVSHILA